MYKDMLCLWGIFSTTMKNRCLEDDPTARADCRELLVHPFCSEEVSTVTPCHGEINHSLSFYDTVFSLVHLSSSVLIERANFRSRTLFHH